MTLTELKAQLAVLCSEFPLATYTSQVTTWFNLAMDEVARKKVIEGEKPLTSTATISEYLFEGLIEPKREGVSFNGNTIVMATRKDLNQIYTKWQDLDPGTPLYYLFEKGKVILVPTPLESDKSIIVSGYYFADALSDGGDEPFEVAGVLCEGLQDFELLLLEYAIGMAKYSLGMYSNTQDALSNFYALLADKVSKLKPKEDMERDSFGKDNYVLRKMRRINNA